MATLSTVSVDFVANTAKFTQGLAAIKTNTKSTMQNVEKDSTSASRSINLLTNAIAGLVSVAVFSKLVQNFTNVAKQMSAIADEAEKVGASASKFYALDVAAKKNGASLSDFKIAYKELQKSINEALAGNQQTVNAFNQLGLSFTYLASLKPDERFDLITKSLQKITDENKRAELGTILLGKAYNEISSTITNLTSATEGRILFSDKDIKTIDGVSKAFEGVSNAIDDQFKAAIITLAPALEQIAKLATLIVNNWGKALGVLTAGFAALSIASAGFVRILNFDLVAALAKLQKSGGILGLLATAADKVRLALAYAAFGINVAWKALGGSIGVVLTTITAAIATGLTAFTGTLLLLSKGAKLVGMDTFARKSEELYDSTFEWLAQLSGYAPNPNQFGFTQAQKDAADAALAAKKVQKESNDAQLQIDKETASLLAQTKETVKQGEEYAKSMERFGEQVRDSVKTPVEIANDELDKLNEAFINGYIGIDVYNKAVDKLKNSLDGITRAQIDLTSQTEVYQNEVERFAGKAAASEMFGAGTIVGTLGQAGGKAAPLPKGIGEIVSPFEQAQKDELSRLKSLSDQLKKDAMTSEEVYAQRVIDINKAATTTDEYGNSLITVEQQTYGLVEAQKQLQIALSNTWQKTNPEILQAFNYMSDFADQFSRAIVEGQSFGDALKNVFKSILRDITTLILRTAILQGIMAAIGLASPVAATSFGQLTGIIPTPRAKGGPVSMGEVYRVGEAGPETFVPAANGYILPNDMQSGETVNVYQTINVQTGVAQTVKAEMFSLLPRFKQEAMAGVLDAKQRGGSYSKLLTA